MARVVTWDGVPWRVGRQVLPWRPRIPWLAQLGDFWTVSENPLNVVFVPLTIVGIAYWSLLWVIALTAAPFVVIARVIGLIGLRVVCYRCKLPDYVHQTGSFWLPVDRVAYRQALAVRRYPVASSAEADQLVHHLATLLASRPDPRD